MRFKEYKGNVLMFRLYIYAVGNAFLICPVCERFVSI